MRTYRDTIEVHQAQAFLAVAEELHFGRAAERLNLAQPPLSRLIKQLERQLGAQLFERSTRHVSLTPAGRALIDPATRLIETSRESFHAVQGAISGETGRVRIGFAGASVHGIMIELTRTVRRARPGLVLELHSSQFSHHGLERVLDGSLDVAIGRWDFLPAEVGSRVMAIEEVLVALPAGHRLATTPFLTFTDLAEDAWVVLPGGFGAALQNRLTSLATAAGFVPRIAQTAPDSWTQLALVAAETGISLTLDSIRDNVGTEGVVYRPIRGHHPPLEVRMIWRSADTSPALRTVNEIAARLFPDPRPPDD